MDQPFIFARIEGLLDAEHGLTTGQAEERRDRYGPNDILEPTPSGWRRVVGDTLRDPMVWFLFGTALLFTALGDYVEAGVLSAALVPIIAMDAYLHRRTQASTEGLATLLTPNAVAHRDGEFREIAATELVPADLVRVGVGDSFPADGVIVRGDALQVDESALTGESLPIRKEPISRRGAPPFALATGNASWVSAGTRLLTGQADMRVVFTGRETDYGQIVRSARANRQGRTPLQGAITALVNVLVASAIVICIALAATRFYQGYGLTDAVLSAITLAVAALPEEFPVVFTFFLGVGVFRLAHRKALVRRAVVVENIGRVSCICSDKTGTLTEGRLRLTHRVPAGSVTADRLVRIAAMASRQESLDPLDLALLDEAPAPDHRTIATFPFTEDRRRESAVFREPSGAIMVVVKGAPETVLAMAVVGEEERLEWQRRTRNLAASGHKVIAVASRSLDSWSGGEPDRDFQFAGLLAFEDPVREGVAEAVAEAQSAGIRVIMVTGDHPATAAAIAEELGIGHGAPRILEGQDFARLVDELGVHAPGQFDVLARAVPSQKLDLVRALQQNGEIVAVTGDGVNDVPALQGADIGIAMGERGTRSAREAASIVLLDDNFRTIVGAIAEGRQLFRNLKLSFAYLLMVHMPLVVTATLIPFVGLPLLYLPIHIVWIELIIHPTALLVFQQMPAPRRLGVAGRGGPTRVFERREWLIMVTVGVFMTAIVTFGYTYSLGSGRDTEHARTMALAAMILGSSVITVALGGLRGNAGRLVVAGALGSAALLMQIPFIANLLHLKPLHADDLLLAGIGALAVGSIAALLPRRS